MSERQLRHAAEHSSNSHSGTVRKKQAANRRYSVDDVRPKRRYSEGRGASQSKVHSRAGDNKRIHRGETKAQGTRRSEISIKSNNSRVAGRISTGGKNNAEALKYLLSAVPVLVIVIAVILVVNGSSKGINVVRHTQAEINEGVNYIKTLESTDVAPVQETISNKQAITEIADIENGEINVWSQFTDAVIIGDSRAIGFSYYDFLPEERVLAHYGAYLYEIEDYYLERLIQLNPKYVFIAIGINDIGNGVWATFSAFGNGFGDVMDTIHAYLPNAVICANSVLTCTEPALSNAGMWYEIPDYNAALKTTCEERGYIYIDNDALCQELSYLYEPDGIHVNYNFYEPWAINMIKGVANS